MKIAIAIIVVVVLAITLIVLFQRRKPTAELTDNEAKVRDLVRQVYGTNILGEQIVRNGSDAVLVVELQNEKLKQLQINLSSLARKHEEGVSLAVLKASLRFD